MSVIRYNVKDATYRLAGGRPFSAAQLRDVRNALADGLITEITALVKRYGTGEITLGEWAQAFAELIRVGTAAGYALGSGGVRTLDTAAVSKIDTLIGKQTQFVANFIQDIAGGTQSDAQIEARAQLYAGQAVHAYEAARADANGIDLPVYPGDGGTPCLGRCRCWWEITTDDATATAYWHTQGDDGVCEGCAGRGADYSPYVQERTWMR